MEDHVEQVDVTSCQGDKDSPLIHVEDLSKKFNGSEILSHVSLSIGAAEKVALIGRSGCGKTVLAKHFNGLLTGDSGKVRVCGVDLTSATEEQVYAVRRKIGYVFQGNALLASLDIYANISMTLRDDPYEFPSSNEKDIATRVKQALADVGLEEELLHRMPNELSGGQRKRVAVARAIISRPPVIIYDEPTTGLDPESTQLIVDLIERLYESSRSTVIAITHERKLMKALGRVVFLDEGRVHFDGTYPKFSHSDDPTIRSFLAEGRVASSPAIAKTA